MRQNWESAEAIVTLVRGRMQTSGPITAEELGEKLALESKPSVRRPGSHRGRRHSAARPFHAARTRHSDQRRTSDTDDAATPIEWCERRLLARIHRRTLDGLRRQIQPAEPADFIRFLMRWHHVAPGTQWHGRAGLRKALPQLQGYESGRRLVGTAHFARALR